MIILNEKNFKDEVESSDKLCVIDLYADWCGPCRMLAPVLEELEAEYPDVKFCKVNVDNEPAIARMFISDYFKGINSFDYLENFSQVTKEYAENILKEVFNEEKMVISIVRGK